jgi:hypothetical protein
VIRLLIDSIVVTDDALIVKHIVPTIDMFRLEHTFRVACCVLREKLYVRSLLSAVCCPPSAVRRLLSAVCCPPSATCCLPHLL